MEKKSEYQTFMEKNPGKCSVFWAWLCLMCLWGIIHFGLYSDLTIMDVGILIHLFGLGVVFCFPLFGSFDRFMS